MLAPKDLNVVDDSDTVLYPLDRMKDETTSGAKDGSAIQAKVFNNMWYAMLNVLTSAGITPSGTVESSSETQFLTAMLSLRDDVIDTDVTLSGDDTVVPSSPAVKAYVTANTPDKEFVTVTAGTQALTQSTTDSFTYSIADFVGDGLVPSEIRELHLECSASGDNGSVSEVYYTYPDGVEHRIFYRNFSNDDNGHGSKSDVVLPVKQSQLSTVTLRIVKGSATSFEIFGATQRV